MSAITWNLSRNGAETRLVVEGAITESADFGPLLDEQLDGTLVIDMAGIVRINSCGTRAWIDFVAALDERGLRLVFERCSPSVVSQINLISNFTGQGGHVRSVFAPYYCPSCDSEHLEFVDLGASSSPDVHETITCPQCGTAAEFSDLPDHYFAFCAGEA